MIDVMVGLFLVLLLLWIIGIMVDIFTYKDKN